jgi:hypothetical protein
MCACSALSVCVFLSEGWVLSEFLELIVLRAVFEAELQSE